MKSLLFTIFCFSVLTHFVYSDGSFEVTLELQNSYDQSAENCNVKMFDLCHMNNTYIDYSECNATVLIESIRSYIKNKAKVSYKTSENF